jgi:hypothetical protein
VCHGWVVSVIRSRHGKRINARAHAFGSHRMQVRDYLVRMLNKLFTLEKNRADSGDAPQSSSSSSSSSSKSKSSRGSSGREKKSSRRKKGDDEDGGGRRGGRIQVSQVKLLAEHCYSISDDKIEEACMRVELH